MQLIKFANPVIWGSIAVLLLYEFVALFNKVPGDTISSIVWRNMTTHPALGFVFGALVGHFCLQRDLGRGAAAALFIGLAFGHFIWKRGGGL
jgi:hypothetical protein